MTHPFTFVYNPGTKEDPDVVIDETVKCDGHDEYHAVVSIGFC